jgi:hypothetical protein
LTLSKSEKNLSAFKAFLLGAFASAIATTLTYPIQVVQTKSRVNKCLHRKIEGQIDRNTERQKNRNTERQKNRKTERWRDGETEKERWRDRKWRDRKMDRQNDGKTKRRRVRETQNKYFVFFSSCRIKLYQVQK